MPVCPSNGKWKSTPTVSESSPSIGLPFLDTATSEPWIGQPSNPSSSSVEDSPVKTSVSLGNGQGSTENAAACGGNTSEPFAHYDPATSSWRTSQVSLLTLTWDECSETWPRAGTMRNGIAFPQVPLAPLTGGIASGLWPTPCSLIGSMYLEKNAHVRNSMGLGSAVHLWPTPHANCGTGAGHAAQGGINIQTAVKMWPTPKAANPGSRPNGKGGKILQEEVLIAEGIRQRGVKMRPTPSSNNGTGGATGLAGGSGNRKKLYALLGEEEGKKMGCQSLNPYWVEWLMGYPLGWTDLGDSGTRSSRKSSKHSGA